MIRYLVIIINSLAVFLYSLFSGDGGITVTSTIPPTVKAGQEAVMEIKITKGSMAGFAKLQLELPEGLAAKESENKGANYTYNGGIAKWVWASLPPESEITIKVKLISSEEATGVKTINAKFSFVENNAKQVVEMTPAEITISNASGEPAVAAETTPPAATEAPAAIQPTVESQPAVTQAAEPAKEPEISQPQANAKSNTGSNAEPPGNVKVKRTVTKGGVNEFIVNLQIMKDGTKGFARYSDNVPDGYIVNATKTDGSSFSVADGKLKFVWVAVPEKENLEIEYTVTGPAGNLALKGEYSYLEDNQSKEYKLTDNVTLTFVGGQPAAAEATPTETKAPEPVATEEPAKPARNEAAMEANLAKKEGNVNYHVQIGAFTNANVDAGRLKKVFHVSETISSEMQGGFSKFMVGTHAEYKGARDHREAMKSNNGIKSAFVVAYNGSQRITVQEALMITNQKWFK